MADPDTGRTLSAPIRQTPIQSHNSNNSIAKNIDAVIDQTSTLDKLGTLYQRLDHTVCTDPLSNETLAQLGFRYKIVTGSFQRIPSSGPAIVVANRPFDRVGELSITHLLRSIRPDAKLLVDNRLYKSKETADIIIRVDRFNSSQQNMTDLCEALSFVRQGGLLLIFPASEGSSIKLRKRRIWDPPWTPSSAQLIRTLKVPVVPIYIDANTKLKSQLTGLFQSPFRMLPLPSKHAQKRNITVKIYIGKAMSTDQFERFDTHDTLAHFLRARTYLLSVLGEHQHPVKWIHDIRNGFRRNISKAPIAAAEIERLKESSLMIRSGHMSVLVAESQDIPTIMNELGRLRELTFRGIGGGTGKKRDISIYDRYYKQLFIWDDKHIVGGYHLGIISDIIKTKGVKGLYTASLFKLSNALVHDLENAIELGRAFVRAEYQKSYSALMMLWKGIGAYVAQQPRHAILFGSANISNEYQPVSRQLLVEFLRANEYEVKRARQVKARRPFKPHRYPLMDDLSIQNADLQWLSTLVSQLENDNKGVPVLLRQYLKMGGQILAFNIDKDFHNFLDCLLIVNLNKIDPTLLSRYLGKQGAQHFIQYHRSVPYEIAGH